MKRSKKICTFLLVLTLIVTSLFCFGGCFDKNKDGLDGRDFDLFSAYTQLVERGEFSGTYAEFVAQYLNVEVEWSENAALTTAINSSLAGSVSLKVVVEYTTSTGGIFGNQGTKKTMARYGSGVIIDLDKEQGDAYILTNCHVIYDGAFVGWISSISGQEANRLKTLQNTSNTSSTRTWRAPRQTARLPPRLTLTCALFTEMPCARSAMTTRSRWSPSTVILLLTLPVLTRS